MNIPTNFLVRPLAIAGLKMIAALCCTAASVSAATFGDFTYTDNCSD
jgi:hypothetical protein